MERQPPSHQDPKATYNEKHNAVQLNNSTQPTITSRPKLLPKPNARNIPPTNIGIPRNLSSYSSANFPGSPSIIVDPRLNMVHKASRNAPPIFDQDQLMANFENSQYHVPSAKLATSLTSNYDIPISSHNRKSFTGIESNQADYNTQEVTDLKMDLPSAKTDQQHKSPDNHVVAVSAKSSLARNNEEIYERKAVGLKKPIVPVPRSDLNMPPLPLRKTAAKPNRVRTELPDNADDEIFIVPQNNNQPMITKNKSEGKEPINAITSSNNVASQSNVKPTNIIKQPYEYSQKMKPVPIPPPRTNALSGKGERRSSPLERMNTYHQDSYPSNENSNKDQNPKRRAPPPLPLRTNDRLKRSPAIRMAPISQENTNNLPDSLPVQLDDENRKKSTDNKTENRKGNSNPTELSMNGKSRSNSSKDYVDNQLELDILSPNITDYYNKFAITRARMQSDPVPPTPNQSRGMDKRLPELPPRNLNHFYDRQNQPFTPMNGDNTQSQVTPSREINKRDRDFKIGPIDNSGYLQLASSFPSPSGDSNNKSDEPTGYMTMELVDTSNDDINTTAIASAAIDTTRSFNRDVQSALTIVDDIDGDNVTKSNYDTLNQSYSHLSFPVNINGNNKDHSTMLANSEKKNEEIQSSSPPNWIRKDSNLLFYPKAGQPIVYDRPTNLIQVTTSSMLPPRSTTNHQRSNDDGKFNKSHPWQQDRPPPILPERPAFEQIVATLKFFLDRKKFLPSGNDGIPTGFLSYSILTDDSISNERSDEERKSEKSFSQEDSVNVMKHRLSDSYKDKESSRSLDNQYECAETNDFITSPTDSNEQSVMGIRDNSSQKKKKKFLNFLRKGKKNQATGNDASDLTDNADYNHHQGNSPLGKSSSSVNVAVRNSPIGMDNLSTSSGMSSRDLHNYNSPYIEKYEEFSEELSGPPLPPRSNTLARGRVGKSLPALSHSRSTDSER
ncbi:hypothetical protein TrispH2_007706 [Trichoplax sp. H2]|nr:hypothetical protein TrispH2_007706 [Trichoplax sp. H2]|eukprot:RDD40214.1 hypothetical protein TrispH2_007706 [Trichoplax sp. H2]